MQYKFAELRRAYYIWSTRMQQKMNMIGEKLQLVIHWWTSLPSVRYLQHHFTQFYHSAKTILIGMY